MLKLIPIMPYIWLGLAVLLGVAEAMTYQLVAIWYAAGAVAAMFVSYTGAPLWAQFFTFIIVSLIVLYFFRPIATKNMQNKKIRTNVSSLIGMVGVVTSEINNVRSQGRVTVNNSDWAAYSEDGEIIPTGEEVVIKSISGVKLVVEHII